MGSNPVFSVVFLYFFKLRLIASTAYKLLFGSLTNKVLSYNPPQDPEEYSKFRRTLNSALHENRRIFLAYNFKKNFKNSLYSTWFQIMNMEVFKQTHLINKINFGLIALYNRKKFVFIKNTTHKLFLSSSGFFDFLQKFKITILAALICVSVLFFTMYVHTLSVQKILAMWLLGFANIYWLFSTFVFFKKKYHWGKFTSANQRFWKRTLLIFWVLEFFLFGIFLYLSLNANSESYYMLDQIQIYKEFLFPVRSFVNNLFIYFFIVIFLYLIMLSLKWQIFNKISIAFLIFSYLVATVFFNEAYQFFHVINHYSSVDWEYDTDAEIWSIELESRKERTYHHYSMLLFILKFWHIVFIVFVWFFFLLRGFEIKRFYYPSIAGNLNNFIFLYLFNWLFMLNWLKFLVVYISNYTFSEFFLQIRENLISFFFFDFLMIQIAGIFPGSITTMVSFKNYSFVYQTIFFALND